MKIINTIIKHIYARRKYLLLGLLALIIFQLPITPFIPSQNSSQVASVSEAQIIAPEVKAAETKATLTAAFLGEDMLEITAKNMIQVKEDFVSTRPAYSASLRVIQKHENTIRDKADQYGVPQDVAIGVGLLENGGSETAKSKAGALGVFQLMPGTARNLGLTVNNRIDQRKDPAKNIDAGMRYLSANYDRFGDWGLATWAYHAGEGNVSKAIKLYFKEQYNVSLTGLKNINQMKRYIDQNNVTVHDVLSSVAVKKFTKKLGDDSAAYPYKVLATAQLFRDSLNEF